MKKLKVVVKVAILFANPCVILTTEGGNYLDANDLVCMITVLSSPPLMANPIVSNVAQPNGPDSLPDVRSLSVSNV